MYIDILIRWNSRVNLTAVRDPQQIVTRHFGESFFAARNALSSGRPNETSRVIDVGSGAGFPGIPFKIWKPEIGLTLIESNHKKATFVKEVTRALGLNDVEVFAARAADYEGPQGEIVTLRAVEKFGEILPVAAGLVRPGGQLVLLIGETQAEIARQQPGFAWNEAARIPLSDKRIVLSGVKCS